MTGQKKTKYHKPPLKFDYALQKYVHDIEKLEKFKKELKKKSCSNR